MLFCILNFVQKYINVGKSLSDAFNDFATQYGYTPKSVKKCFYSAIEGFSDHPILAKKMQIDLKSLTDPANVFNMASVKKYVLSNGGNVDKSIFALCFGDLKESNALKKRFEKFFPDFCACDHQKKEEALLGPIALQAKYFDLDSSTHINA